MSTRMSVGEIRQIAAEVVSMLERSGYAEDEVLDIKGVAAMLKCSVSKIRSRLDEIPHVMFGGEYRYLRGFAGTPYKYFRIVAIGRLSDGETLNGCTIQYAPRQTDQPR